MFTFFCNLTLKGVAMINLDNSSIKQALQKEVCPIHNRSAEIETTSTRIYILNPCCSKFHRHLKLLMLQMLQEKIKEIINKLFKNFSKN